MLPINTSTDDKVNEVKAELLNESENNENDRKKNGIAEARENYKFDVSSSFCVLFVNVGDAWIFPLQRFCIM